MTCLKQSYSAIIAIKDLVTETTTADLFAAETNSHEQLNSFVEGRLMTTKERKCQFSKSTDEEQIYYAFLAVMKRTGLCTGTAKTIKADKNIMQRLFTAYEAWQDISKSLVAGTSNCNF